jgi:putative transposase
MKKASVAALSSAEALASFKGCRFRPHIISYAVWRWATKSGLPIAKRIRSLAPPRGDEWHLDEVVVTINGTKHWLWRAVDQNGAVLDVLVQRRRDTAAAKRLMGKLLKRHGAPARDRDGQVAQLCGGQQRAGPGHRTSAAQGTE